MNLGQLRTAIQQRGWDTDTATVQNEVVNAAYREIAGKRRWSWLDTQVTATATVGTNAVTTGFPADVRGNALNAVRISTGTDYYELEYLAPQDFREEQHANRDNGVPAWWTYYAGQLLIQPRPIAAYSVVIDYTKDPPDLSADADTPLIPATYHDVLVYSAIEELAARERDGNTAAWAHARYKEKLREVEQEEGISQGQTSSRVADSGFFTPFEVA